MNGFWTCPLGDVGMIPRLDVIPRWEFEGCAVPSGLVYYVYTHIMHCNVYLWLPFDCP